MNRFSVDIIKDVAMEVAEEEQQVFMGVPLFMTNEIEFFTVEDGYSLMPLLNFLIKYSNKLLQRIEIDVKEVE